MACSLLTSPVPKSPHKQLSLAPSQEANNKVGTFCPHETSTERNKSFVSSRVCVCLADWCTRKFKVEWMSSAYFRGRNCEAHLRSLRSVPVFLMCRISCKVSVSGKSERWIHPRPLISTYPNLLSSADESWKKSLSRLDESRMINRKSLSQPQVSHQLLLS